MGNKLQLSVLDQTPVRRGSHAEEALQESIQLARKADLLGYTRYWLSEHHNTRMLAGASPEILIARLAAETKKIRVGSGGIMLPNHSSLKVAENFRLLEGLYPNRIDLGIGRATGSDRVTARLLNPSNQFNPEDYLHQINELESFLTDAENDFTFQGKIMAIPHISTMPDLWMLSSSGESALLAAHFGMSFSFAKFINPVGVIQAVENYKQRFRPSLRLARPRVSIALFAFCSENQEKLEEAQAIMDYRLLSLEKGRMGELPSYEEIKHNKYSDIEWQRVLHNRQRMVIGSPAELKEQFQVLADTADVDELVISTFADQFEDRVHSYELIAQQFRLEAPHDNQPAVLEASGQY